MGSLTSGLTHALCDAARAFVSYLARAPLVRSYSVQAQYWHDPFDDQWGKSAYNFIGIFAFSFFPLP